MDFRCGAWSIGKAVTCDRVPGHDGPHHALPLHPQAPGVWWLEGARYRVTGHDQAGYPLFAVEAS